MKKCSIEVSSIETMGLLDGPGVRVVVFLSKCNLRCIYCHNPETWCTSGTNYDVKELFKKIMRYKSYIKNGGVTFSGGEPLLQADALIEIIKMLKDEGIHVAIDTAGYVKIDDSIKKVLDLSDLIILDIKSTNSKKYFEITGGDISYQDDFINYVNTLDKQVWIRQVIVPEVNDNEANIVELNQYIKKIKNVDKVELLGYHDMAKDKYNDLGIPYRLLNTPNMDVVKLKRLQESIIFNKSH